jgi:outer membrane protein W
MMVKAPAISDDIPVEASTFSIKISTRPNPAGDIGTAIRINDACEINRAIRKPAFTPNARKTKYNLKASLNQISRVITTIIGKSDGDLKRPE